MPAAAVIPAPIAYIKVVAAKRRESARRRPIHTHVECKCTTVCIPGNNPIVLFPESYVAINKGRVAQNLRGVQQTPGAAHSSCC